MSQQVDELIRTWKKQIVFRKQQNEKQKEKLCELVFISHYAHSKWINERTIMNKWI